MIAFSAAIAATPRAHDARRGAEAVDRIGAAGAVADLIRGTAGSSPYLAGLIDRFDGSLPMAFAGYNAGPHRVKRWVRNYGDPRGSVEATIDWIESIPFNETRNYVQRVLENLIVYRQRLEGRHVALNLSSMNANMTKAKKP